MYNVGKSFYSIHLYYYARKHCWKLSYFIVLKSTSTVWRLPVVIARWEFQLNNFYQCTRCRQLKTILKNAIKYLKLKCYYKCLIKNIIIIVYAQVIQIAFYQNREITVIIYHNLIQRVSFLWVSSINESFKHRTLLVLQWRFFNDIFFLEWD